MTRGPHSDGRRIWYAAGMMALAAGVFWSPLSTVVGASTHVDQYSQILVVPPLAVCMLWLDRKRFLTSPSYSWLGAGLFALCVALFFVFRSTAAALDPSTVLSVSIGLFALACISSFVFSFGLRAFRAEAYPLFFLVLMSPLPDALRERVVVFLQQGSAVVTDWMFSIAHIPFNREGVVLFLPAVTIEIAQECSGIRSSLVLFIGGLVLGHLFLRTPWSKLALIVLLVPMTILKNGIRIFVLTTLGMYVDSSFLSGKLHHEGGFVFFAIAFGLLWGIVWVLQKLENRVLGPIRPVTPPVTQPSL